MTGDADLDALMSAYCNGLYAMDPRTTYPFWDYDFAPLFSSAWMDKILAATAVCNTSTPGAYTHLFAGPSVPRKELIYSLADMKIAHVARDDRLRQSYFWIELLKEWCGDSWLSSHSNRALELDKPDQILAATNWVHMPGPGGLAVGRMVVALNALAYGLYSDIFVHQCAECRGPYEVALPHPLGIAGGRPQLLVRSWSGLRPYRLLPGCKDPGYDQVKIAAVYQCTFSIDIYNHVSWDQPPVNNLIQYAVWLDGHPVVMIPDEMSALAYQIGRLAETTFRSYQNLGFEEKKRLWVRQRNYQFRDFFAFAGLPGDAPEMEAAVKGKPLLRSPIWNMTLPRDQIFRVWKQCLDPRTEVYEGDWLTVFREIFGDRSRP